MRLAQFHQGVASGGVNQTFSCGGTVEYMFNVDAHKIGLWKGFGIAMHATTRFGKDILADAGAFTLPNTALMYPLPGDYRNANVTGLMVSQFLFDKKVQVMAGKLNSMDLLQGLYPHNVDYGLDGFMNANSFMSMLSWGRWLTLSQYGAAGWTLKVRHALDWVHCRRR